jgi:cellobiose-specific phosphotransferase system component IIA
MVKKLGPFHRASLQYFRHCLTYLDLGLAHFRLQQQTYGLFTMTLRTTPVLKAFGLAIALTLGALAQAADPVTEAMQAANAPYRLALYKTNGKSQEEAMQALVQAQQEWSKLSAQFAAKPSAPYDRDPAFAASVADITKVYATALEEVKANQLTPAHNTLERVRDIMADMRQRNNVVVFSDHMNAYHSQMEVLMIHGADTLALPKGMLLLTAQTGALSYLAKQLGTQTSDSLSKNAEFTTLLGAVKQSVANLEAALLNQDAVAIKDALGKLKGPYSKIFAKFG